MAHGTERVRLIACCPRGLRPQSRHLSKKPRVATRGLRVRKPPRRPCRV